MTDAWAAAAAEWGTQSTVTAVGIGDRDCTGRTGGGGTGGGGGKGGGGGTGGGGGKGQAEEAVANAAARSTATIRTDAVVTTNAPATATRMSTLQHGCQHDDCGCQAHEHCSCGCHVREHGSGDSAGTSTGVHTRPGGGITLGWKNPNRPARHYGTSTGVIPNGQLDPCDFSTPPWNTWPGTRGDLFLPYLFLRANAGDLGARPVVGPFWESPDILLLADVDPAVAPPIPPELGQTAKPGKPTTLYAHVWNFGIAQAPNVVVEFYWCDPALGINATGAHLIGVTAVALGARGSGRSHAVVKCPTRGTRRSSTAATSAFWSVYGTRRATGWAIPRGTRRSTGTSGNAISTWSPLATRPCMPSRAWRTSHCCCQRR